jgi:hypothetical protein
MEIGADSRRDSHLLVLLMLVLVYIDNIDLFSRGREREGEIGGEYECIHYCRVRDIWRRMDI